MTMIMKIIHHGVGLDTVKAAQYLLGLNQVEHYRMQEIK